MANTANDCIPFFFEGHNLVLNMSQRYAANNQVVIQASTVDGEPFADVTRCLAHLKLPETNTLLDTNNLPGIDHALVKQGVVKLTGRKFPSGFCEYPEVTVLINTVTDKVSVCDRYADSIINGNPGHYSDIEVHGVVDINKGKENSEGTHFCIDDDDPELFSVYLRLKAGGVDCVGDFSEYSNAVQYANELSSIYGWGISNFTSDL
jgi:hypothetical protein